MESSVKERHSFSHLSTLMFWKVKMQLHSTNTLISAAELSTFSADTKTFSSLCSKWLVSIFPSFSSAFVFYHFITQPPLFSSKMLCTGIPELASADDINYLRYAFAIGKSDEEAAIYFKKLIFSSLNTKTTIINDAIHVFVHR